MFLLLLLLLNKSKPEIRRQALAIKKGKEIGVEIKVSANNEKIQGKGKDMLFFIGNEGETKGDECNELNEGNKLGKVCCYLAFVCIYFSHGWLESANYSRRYEQNGRNKIMVRKYLQMK